MTTLITSNFEYFVVGIMGVEGSIKMCLYSVKSFLIGNVNIPLGAIWIGDIFAKVDESSLVNLLLR